MAHEEGDSAETEERNPNSRVAWMARAQRAEAELSALRSRVAVLEGTLAFYAEPLRWKSTSLYICGHRSPAPILTDEGHRARAALTKEPTP